MTSILFFVERRELAKLVCRNWSVVSIFFQESLISVEWRQVWVSISRMFVDEKVASTTLDVPSVHGSIFMLCCVRRITMFCKLLRTSVLAFFRLPTSSVNSCFLDYLLWDYWRFVLFPVFREDGMFAFLVVHLYLQLKLWMNGSTLHTSVSKLKWSLFEQGGS